MSLRLQCDGYIIRLGAWPGCEGKFCVTCADNMSNHNLMTLSLGYKEGVSLTVYDELARWEKYAFGCNELLWNPLRYWPTRGPFTKVRL